MFSKGIISISEARKKIFKIADEVQKPDTYYLLTENGKAKAVIMSAEEFESWMETMEIMSDPELMKSIKEADEDFKKGNYVSLEEVLKKEGYILSDKAKKYGISRKTKKSGKKKSRKN